MASKSGSKSSLERWNTPEGCQMVEGNPHRLSPVHVSKASKSDTASVNKLPIIAQGIDSDLNIEKTGNKRHNSLQKGSVNYVTEKLDSSLCLVGSTQLSTGINAKVSETTGVLETIAHREKKTSGHGAVKTSTSAKVRGRASILAKGSGSAKISDRADFVEGGKSSMCRGSTSSNISDESTCSSLISCIYKPHKANDLRWEAIRAVRVQNGVLGLSHFRLLKRLGCGDIGSVYLSALTGIKCYFAMKVMDKASLASRKKLSRALTEREILQLLDHPFLPTLYSHFETTNFCV